MLVPVVAVLAACGGGEVRSAQSAMPDSTGTAAAAPDSTKKAAADTTKAPTGTIAVDMGTTPPPPPKKAEGPLRDSAFGPKFAVDSTGKVVPLKKKP